MQTQEATEKKSAVERFFDELGSEPPPSKPANPRKLITRAILLAWCWIAIGSSTAVMAIALLSMVTLKAGAGQGAWDNSLLYPFAMLTLPSGLIVYGCWMVFHAIWAAMTLADDSRP